MARETTASARFCALAWLVSSFALTVHSQGFSSPSAAPAQLAAPAPAAPVTAATLFPRLPNSFTNRADNAVTQWNIVSLSHANEIADVRPQVAHKTEVRPFGKRIKQEKSNLLEE